MNADEKYKALLRRCENLNGKIERLRQSFDRQQRVNQINAEMLAVLEECDEAMAYMSEYDIPLCLPDRVKAVIKKAGGYKND